MDTGGAEAQGRDVTAICRWLTYYAYRGLLARTPYRATIFDLRIVRRAVRCVWLLGSAGPSAEYENNSSEECVATPDYDTCGVGL